MTTDEFVYRLFWFVVFWNGVNSILFVILAAKLGLLIRRVERVEPSKREAWS